MIRRPVRQQQQQQRERRDAVTLHCIQRRRRRRRRQIPKTLPAKASRSMMKNKKNSNSITKKRVELRRPNFLRRSVRNITEAAAATTRKNSAASDGVLTPAMMSRDDNDDDDDDDMSLISTATTEEEKTTTVVATIRTTTARNHHHNSSSSLIPKTTQISLPTATTKIALNPPDSLSDSITRFIESSSRLAASDQLRDFMESSQHVIWQSSRLLVNLALWPVRLPVEISTFISVMVVSSSVDWVRSVVREGVRSGHCATRRIENNDTTTDRVVTCDKIEKETCDIETRGLIPSALALPYIVFEAGLAVIGLDRKKCSVDDTVKDNTDYLDRLRLDYGISTKDSPNATPKSTIKPQTSHPAPIIVQKPDPPKSVYLLRVNDIEVYENSQKLYYLDLGNHAENQHVISLALGQLYYTGASLLANHEHVKLQNNYELKKNGPMPITWNPERDTKKLLQDTLSTETLLQETLVWSGKMPGSRHPVFLARGAIPMSPLSLLRLLWNNDRTSEYNNFNLGRSTLVSLDHPNSDAAVLLGSSPTLPASKIIQSAMKVPFTKLVVKAVCLMHVCELEPPDTGFIIVSRTLDQGPAGNHTDGENVQRTKNEILWGLNILRANDTTTTDLVTLSQVGAHVPGFLAHKIGMMGIGDFFGNVRRVGKKQELRHAETV